MPGWDASKGEHPMAVSTNRFSISWVALAWLIIAITF